MDNEKPTEAFEVESQTFTLADIMGTRCVSEDHAERMEVAVLMHREGKGPVSTHYANLLETELCHAKKRNKYRTKSEHERKFRFDGCSIVSLAVVIAMFMLIGKLIMILERGMFPPT